MLKTAGFAASLVAAAMLSGCVSATTAAQPSSSSPLPATPVARPVTTSSPPAPVAVAQPVQTVTPTAASSWPVCPSGSVQVQLTRAVIGPETQSSGIYRMRSVDLRITVTNATETEVSVNGSSGPMVWAEPFVSGKDAEGFSTHGSGPVTATLKPGQSVAYVYSDASHIAPFYVWAEMTDFKIDERWRASFVSNAVAYACNTYAANTVFSKPVPTWSK